VAGLTRRRSLLATQREAGLLPHIQELKAEPPLWGYRRIWVYLPFVEGVSVNKKRVLRVLREHNLVVQPNPKLTAQRTPSRSKPRPTHPHEWWGVAMP
jgi:putative transposase